MIRILPEAEAEVADATAWYAAQGGRALAGRFTQALRSVIADIQSAPQSHREIRPGLRKCNLHRFPYRVVYAIEGADILVVAVMHQHQRPDYWRARHKP